MTAEHQDIAQSIEALRRWVEKNQWKGYDTFDGLSSPLAKIFTLGVPVLKQFWQQGVRRFPMNIRPLLGIKPSMSTKGMGFFAQGFLRLHDIDGKPEHERQARFCLKWLQEHRCPQFKGNAWANHFDYQSRGGRISQGTPTIVWTSLVGHAFLDAYDRFHDSEYLDVARGIGYFASNELGWIETSHGDICLSYIPKPGGKPVKGEDGVHNASMLGAGFLARLNSVAPDPKYLELARLAMKFSVRAQLPNGAWYYGVAPKWHWIDSFHTGYNLESLHWYSRCSGDAQFDVALQKGYTYFVDTFFGGDGTPRYYDRKTRPLDIQCASQGIQTLVNLSHLDARSIDTALRVARWTIRNMQDASGYFYYRKYPVITNKTPTLHWGQATMFGALATLLQELRRRTTPATPIAATANGG
jgi:hypothetical protein